MSTAERYVFLSYCRENFEEVASLRRELVGAGESVLWDQDFAGGADWEFEIRRALERSHRVVVCFSKESEARPKSGIYPELSLAIKLYRQHKPGSVFIIPVRLSKCEIPPVEIDATRTLRRLQYIDLFPPERRGTGLSRLLASIRGNAPEPYADPHVAGPRREPEGDDPALYFVNRREHEKELQAAVTRHRGEKPGRPLVCVVHGDEIEGHEAFLERLRERGLPEVLKAWHPEDVRQVAIHAPHKMRLSLDDAAPGKDWAGVFWDDLARALGRKEPGAHADATYAAPASPAQTSPDDVIGAVSNRKLAVIISALIPSEQMSRATPERLELFFRFWNERWPDLSERLLLLVCLHVRYFPEHESRRRLLPWKSKGANDRLRRYVAGLDLSGYARLHCVRLPELRPISREDAKDAAGHVEAGRCYDMDVNRVIDLYHEHSLRTEESCIPMVKLLAEFTKRRRSVKT